MSDGGAEFDLSKVHRETQERRMVTDVREAVEPVITALDNFERTSDTYNQDESFSRGDRDSLQWITYQDRPDGNLRQTSRLVVPKKRHVIARGVGMKDVPLTLQTQIEPDGDTSHVDQSVRLRVEQNPRTQDVSIDLTVGPDAKELAGTLFPEGSEAAKFLDAASEMGYRKRKPTTRLHVELRERKGSRPDIKVKIIVTEDQEIINDRLPQIERSQQDLFDAMNTSNDTLDLIDKTTKKANRKGQVVSSKLTDIRSETEHRQDQVAGLVGKLEEDKMDLQPDEVTYSYGDKGFESDARFYDVPILTPDALVGLTRDILLAAPTIEESTSGPENPDSTTITRVVTPGERVSIPNSLKAA